VTSRGGRRNAASGDAAYNTCQKVCTRSPAAPGRGQSAHQLVAVTTFLCSEGADYMTGQAINITGGREMH